MKPAGDTLTAFYWDVPAVKSVESSKVCKVSKVFKRRVQIFPRTDKDYSQLLPDMPDIMSLAEFKNYPRSLA